MTDGFEKPDGLVVSCREFLEDVRGDFVAFFAHVDAFSYERTEHVEIRLERGCRFDFVDESSFDVFDGGKFGHLRESSECRAAELSDAFRYGVDIFSETVLPVPVKSVTFGEVGAYEVPMESPYLRVQRVLRREYPEHLFLHVKKNYRFE